MVGSISKRLRNGKAKKVAASTTGKPSIERKSKNMEGMSTPQLSKNGKLKTSVNDPTLLQSLDYNRFFNNDNQVESYLEWFLARYLVEPRLINLDLFNSNGFQFQDLIEYQGLKHFVSIECIYLVKLVKVFYCNMTIANEELLSEVKNVKIRVRPSDWLTIAGLKYEGEKFDTTKIHSWENYNCTEAVQGMIRPGLQIPKKLNAGSLTVKDQLLRYTYASILIPRGSNYAQMSEEDIFVLWAIKERILLNWPFYIFQHIKKVKDKYMMSLPYVMLVTKILYHYGVDSNLEGEVSVCWSNKFDRRTLNKMKIIQFNGVWQYAHEGLEAPNDEFEEAVTAPAEPDSLP
ncbi:hypothetical protein SESBI_03146 [Sesbania bispinosa]|nr:hypothetical protein SESBI_03146 [Sesbania bispinosa]